MKPYGASLVLFMSKRLRYMLRMWSSLLGWNLDQQHTSGEVPV